MSESEVLMVDILETVSSKQNLLTEVFSLRGVECSGAMRESRCDCHD
jgi:hypothetical protein